mmetsp:Transcript_10048/g.30094  ORF Transcript_10048/g.30094 Transcript_10048/m.30094 type:complete len:269 (-) Transcript_10048:1002-1808(-)
METAPTLALADLPTELLVSILEFASDPLRRNAPCSAFEWVVKERSKLQLVCSKWKDALDRISPLCVRVRTSNHLDKLAVSKFAISELEVAGGQIGIQGKMRKLLAAKEFQTLSGPTLRRICGVENTNIPQPFLTPHVSHFSNLQVLDGVWGIPATGLPQSLQQLGLIDTSHYVGYDMKDVGKSFEDLQHLEVLSLRGVRVDLDLLPPSLQVLLTCDCRVENMHSCSRLQMQREQAGRYQLYIADDARGGVVRLQMHFFTGFPTTWEQF